jgi:tetratricopeptide (TPR) repeat protein
MDRALKALEHRRDFPLERASTYALLGCIFSANNDLDAAHDHFRTALRLRSKYLSPSNPNHPDIGVNYEHLADIELRMSALIDAEQNYEAAARIFAHNYPSNHPTVLRVNGYLAQLKPRLT